MTEVVFTCGFKVSIDDVSPPNIMLPVGCVSVSRDRMALVEPLSYISSTESRMILKTEKKYF